MDPLLHTRTMSTPELHAYIQQLFTPTSPLASYLFPLKADDEACILPVSVLKTRYTDSYSFLQLCNILYKVNYTAQLVAWTQDYGNKLQIVQCMYVCIKHRGDTSTFEQVDVKFESWMAEYIEGYDTAQMTVLLPLLRPNTALAEYLVQHCRCCVDSEDKSKLLTLLMTYI